MMPEAERYNPAEIEPKWQRVWEEKHLFRADRHPGKPKIYILDMFPYPSGSGLHVGHPEGYTATDIVARYKRMRGFDVLHPMGWDAFGLPAEQHAIATGTHPRETTLKNIDTFRRQLKMLGFSYVLGTRLYAQGQLFGNTRIERISETEVWFLENGVLQKIPRYSGVERRIVAPAPALPGRIASTPKSP